LTKIKHLGGRAEWPDRYVGSEESWSNRTALAVAVWRGGKYAQLQFGPGGGHCAAASARCVSGG